MIKSRYKQLCILLLLIIFYQLSIAQSDTSKYFFGKPPIEVITFIKNYYPKYSFPKIIWYTWQNDHANIWLQNIYKKTNGFPPYCASGDFNGDGYTDYFCHIGYGVVDPSYKNQYMHRYILLHGSKEGLNEYPLENKQLSGGQVACIETILISINPDTLLKLYPNKLKGYTIKNISVLMSSHMSIKCFFWDGQKYQKIYLYAD